VAAADRLDDGGRIGRPPDRLASRKAVCIRARLGGDGTDRILLESQSPSVMAYTPMSRAAAALVS
jgi:hypothetical protein